MKKTIKNALLFTLALLPIAIAAGYFTAGYQMKTLDPAMTEPMLEQVGGEQMLRIITAAQTVLNAVGFGFFGYILAAKTGLLRSLKIEGKPLLVTLAVSLVGGVLLSLDHWTFGAAMPELRQSRELLLSADNWLASVLYGGVIEELMMRLFLMSLLTLIIWKIFARKSEKAPLAAITAANIIAALLFAAGHLPSTVAMFGALTPLLLVRCFLLNGAFGVLFGELYRRYGIQYAMLCHALLHIVSKIIWLLFV